MKMRRILEKVQAFLDADSHSQLKQKESISEVLEKLRDKEKELHRELELCTDAEKRKKLQRKLSVCHAQRKKGLTILKELRTQAPE